MSIHPSSNLYTISIHSTARVETILPPLLSFLIQFQSTPPRGWRPSRPSATSINWSFQSTPPRGWRQYSRLLLAHGKHDFNPLHREGGDLAGCSCRYCQSDFNPLHREGGDAGSCGLRPSAVPFQSTPPRGWRQGAYDELSQRRQISIHSTARVETGI